MKRTVVYLAIFVIAISISINAANQIIHKTPPINVTCRESFMKGSYVLVIQNSSAENLALFLSAKGKQVDFNLPVNATKEFGWAQGFKFDANNHFFIWGMGFDTLHQKMPEKELSPWRIGFADGGLAISLSDQLLQSQLAKHISLPMKRKALKAIEIQVNQTPLIVLSQNSEKIFANVTLQPSLFRVNVSKPINVIASFLPYYKQASGQICATQIKVEEILLDGGQTDFLNSITPDINKIVDELFSTYVMYQIESSFWIKLAKVVNLRGKVIDGRLEVIIL